MAKNGIILRCINCKMENYITKKNQKSQTEKLTVSKHCHKCNKHILHKEKK